MNLKTTNNNALKHLECRLCNAALTTTFVDLGMSPLCESVLAVGQIDQMEPYFPSFCFLLDLASAGRHVVHIGDWGCKFIVAIPSVEVSDPRESMS